MTCETIRGKSPDMVFYPSEKFANEIKIVFSDIHRRVREILPEVEILHVGGSSIPGALTKGDLDIQIRVLKKELGTAATLLELIFEPNNMELWNGDLAIFRDEQQYCWKVDILMTVIGTKEDDCFKFRDLLMIRPDLLEQYNAIKLKYEGGVFRDYKEEKDVFYMKLKKIIESVE